MSHTLNQWLKVEQQKRRQQSNRELSSEERYALRRLRNEAHAAGSQLATAGRGGLLPSLVLGVMRRDGYTCKRCGNLGNPENGGITVHHKGGIVESEWLAKKGHKNEPNNLVALCKKCHGEIHESARAADDAKGEDDATEDRQEP